MRYTISLFLATVLAPSQTWAEVPRVVTDIPPVQSLVAMVMGDLGTPELLLDRGADAHSFQLRPSQARALADADLLVWVGPELTPWLERSLEGIGGAGHEVRLLRAEGTHLRDFATAEDDGHDDHAAEADGHAHGPTDPHAWLDPGNAATWLGVIAGELAAADPENAATYRANADRAQATIAALDADLAATLAPAQGKPVVIFHDALGYFADHYGLTVVGSIAGGDAADPGAAHLAELRRQIAETGTLCLFPEAGHDPSLIDPVLEGTAARLGGALDPEAALLTPGPDLYGAMLHGLATTIADCVTAP